MTNMILLFISVYLQTNLKRSPVEQLCFIEYSIHSWEVFKIFVFVIILWWEKFYKIRRIDIAVRNLINLDSQMEILIENLCKICFRNRIKHLFKKVLSWAQQRMWNVKEASFYPRLSVKVIFFYPFSKTLENKLLILFTRNFSSKSYNFIFILA